MRIGIDARFYGLKHAGLGRYNQNLLKELEKISSKNEYYIFLQDDAYDLYQPHKPNFHKVSLSHHPYSIKSQLLDWKVIKNLHLDLVHFTHFSYPILYTGKFIITIHDLIKNEFYKKGASTRSFMMYRVKHSGYDLVLKQALKKSLKIITPTKYVKNEIIKQFHISSTKIIPVAEGAETIFSTTKPNNAASVLKQYKINSPYILYVGSVYPYKNVHKLLEVMHTVLNDPELSKLTLYIVCSRSVFYDRLQAEIKNQKLEDKVKLLGFVPDADLVVLYKNALSYITATLSEGFGITGLEAMAVGCPVLSSNRSCLPEVYGDAALFFDPDNITEIVNQLKQISSGPKLREQLIKKGHEQVNKYSWKKMAGEIHEIYRQVGEDKKDKM